MRQLPVRAGDQVLHVLLDDEDVERIGGRKLSLGSHGYVQFCPPGQSSGCVLLHRWLMGAQVRDGRLVDHKNRVKLDCQKSNLGFVTPSESSANVTGRSLSGYRGVARMRKKWQAYGKMHGVRYSLGTYITAEEAAQVAHDWRVANLPGYRETAPVNHFR